MKVWAMSFSVCHPPLYLSRPGQGDRAKDLKGLSHQKFIKTRKVFTDFSDIPSRRRNGPTEFRGTAPILRVNKNPSRAASAAPELLEFDLSADLLKGFLDLLGFVLADAFLEKFGGDSIGEIERHYRATAEQVQGRFEQARASRV